MKFTKKDAVTAASSIAAYKVVEILAKKGYAAFKAYRAKKASEKPAQTAKTEEKAS